MMDTHILTIHCPDERGLIAKITNVIFKHDLNIIKNDEFVEKDFGQFFMRTEFAGEFEKEVFMQQLLAVLPPSSIVKLTTNQKKNIIMMATREYHCLSDLLLRHQFNDLHANLLAVISNYSLLEELTLKFGIPYYYIDSTGLSREQHEEQILKVINQYHPDYIVLAKYMKILSPAFTNLFPNRIINIHHSFPPGFGENRRYHLYRQTACAALPPFFTQHQTIQCTAQNHFGICP